MKERQVIKVEPRALEEIYFNRGVFGDRLCLRPKKYDLLTAMPGTHDEEVKLKLRRRYRKDAEQLVYEVRRRRQVQGKA